MGRYEDKLKRANTETYKYCKMEKREEVGESIHEYLVV